MHLLECRYANCNYNFTEVFNKSSINNIIELGLIMAWRRSGANPSSEPVIVRLLKHIYVTPPQYVNEPKACYED